MRLHRKTIRRAFLALIALLTMIEIVVLTPSTLEDSKTQSAALDPDTLLRDNEPTLVPDIPHDRIPEYSIQTFKYVSILNGIKQWKLDAVQAFMYNPDKLVHGRDIKAYLFDPDDKVTIIIGQEAKFFMNKKDLEIFGKAHTIFPDGFEFWSDYLRYKPNEKHVTIPTTFAVRGKGVQENGQDFDFTSMGLDYRMVESIVTLPKQAKVNLIKKQVLNIQGVPNQTYIESDQCIMNRKTNFSYFTMDPNRPLKYRFVHITQPNMYTRARRADLNYGDLSNVLNYLVAYGDVLIKETDPETLALRYATGGKADFDTHNDVIVLTQFPQVYQDQDTVTGDIVTMHRDTDVIEIEHSNAYSQGSDTSKKATD